MPQCNWKVLRLPILLPGDILIINVVVKNLKKKIISGGGDCLVNGIWGNMQEVTEIRWQYGTKNGL